MADAKMRSERPISPHLTVYRLTLTMAMSVAHRITGVALYLGTVLLVWWLVAASTSPRNFDVINGFFGTWIGWLVLIGFTWELFHHMLGGIRHLIWDTGRGLGEHERNLFARLTIIGSVSLTILVWLIGLMLRG